MPDLSPLQPTKGAGARFQVSGLGDGGRLESGKNGRHCPFMAGENPNWKITVGHKTWGNPTLNSLDAPDSWKNRPDWAAHQVKGSEKGQVVGVWIGSILTGGMALLFSWHWKKDGLPTPFLYVFGIIGLILFSKAIWETIRLKSFGDPILELGAVPIPPGGTVEGRINLNSTSDKTPDFTVTLACIHRVETGSGKNRHVSETVLWSNEQKNNVLPGGILPISIPVPVDQPPTGGDRFRDSILWRLTVKAPYFGVPFLEKYELPVFRAATDTADKFGS